MAAGTYDIKELNNISKWVIDANSQLTIGSDAIGEIGPVDDSACDLFFSTTNKCTGIQFSDESWGLLRIESNGLLTVAHVDSSLTRYFPSQGDDLRRYISLAASSTKEATLVFVL